MPNPIGDDFSSDSSDEWEEAEAAVEREYQYRGELDAEEDAEGSFSDRDEDDEWTDPERQGGTYSGFNRSPTPERRVLSSERDDGEESLLESSAMSVTTTDVDDIRGTGQLTLRVADSDQTYDTDAQDDYRHDDSSLGDEDSLSEFSDQASLVSGMSELDHVDGEDDEEVLIRYIGVASARRELKISQVIEQIKGQVFKRALKASQERRPAKAGAATRTWKATDAIDLVGAIQDVMHPEESDDARPPLPHEEFFKALADYVERDEVDVRTKLMKSEKHDAMCYVRAYLGMEQLVTMTVDGPRIEVGEDNKHLLATYLLANELERSRGQKQQLYRALRVDVQQVVDQLEAPEDELERSDWEPIATGWNVLREHAEKEEEVRHRTPVHTLVGTAAAAKGRLPISGTHIVILM